MWQTDNHRTSFKADSNLSYLGTQIFAGVCKNKNSNKFSYCNFK